MQSIEEFRTIKATPSMIVEGEGLKCPYRKTVSFENAIQ